MCKVDERGGVMNKRKMISDKENWFTIEKIDENTSVIS